MRKLSSQMSDKQWTSGSLISVYPRKLDDSCIFFIIYRGQNFIFDICSAPCELWRWESTLICVGCRCYVKVEVLFLDCNFPCYWPDMWSWYNVQLCQSPLLPHTIKIFISHADDVKPVCLSGWYNVFRVNFPTYTSLHTSKKTETFPYCWNIRL